MLSAKRIFATFLVALLVGTISAALMAFGIRQFRFVVYVSVLTGVGAVAVGLLCQLSGKLKNDLKD